ncbi:MAG: AAA family ATPase [Clostridium saudiense]|uniref:AAA family ATPase n=1 Tax=Clostridium saudiense TaxID=1414720 RepID=UPI0029122632|nr:AAA family ATPase [Clostridium saudiense]MDU3520906.1 AAA family ATPase [Clostridium saudiense]
MNIKEFKDLGSREEQINFLMKYWEIEEQYLIGTIYNKNPDYMGITDVQAIGRSDILKNPFNEEDELKVKCLIRSNVFNIDYGDKVIFKFTINESMYYPIKTDTKKIFKLINIEKIEALSKWDIINEFKKREIVGNVNYIVSEVDIEEKLNKKIQDTEIELSNRKAEFEKELLRKREISDKELKRLETRKKNEFRKLDEVELLLNNINEELNNKEKLIDNFKKYGFDFGNNNKENRVSGKTNISKNKYIEYIKNYLAFREDKKLYYSEEILEQFYAGLCTNQLIVLSGQPGTGKTSLVEGFCNAISAKLTIISVQPNWTDNQDLLGFFNPIEGTYISTTFLDAIIEAENNPEQLHIICLDEMNLAHVEYYFSEFLSKLQSEDKKITLYSEYLYNEARSEVLEKIEFLIEKSEANNYKTEEKINLLKFIDFEEYNKLKKKWNSLNRYRYEIKIPDNIRFVGTINKDETTKNLSPKVIDRSYIIEIDNCSKDLVTKMSNPTARERKKYNENLYIKPNEFNINNINISQELKDKLDSIINILVKLDITLSNRINNQIKELNGAEIFNESEIFDVIVATKILPKINNEIDNYDEDIREELRKNIENTSISKVIFEKMEKSYEQSGIGILTFWR